jgi:hypothetical protein
MDAMIDMGATAASDLPLTRSLEREQLTLRPSNTTRLAGYSAENVRRR